MGSGKGGVSAGGGGGGVSTEGPATAPEAVPAQPISLQLQYIRKTPLLILVVNLQDQE